MRLIRLAWPLLPAMLAFLVALWLTSHARGVPDLDYWDIFGGLVDGDGLNITFGTLYATSNEHIVVLAKLVFLANLLVTGGDNFGLSAIACSFALVIACLLARMLATAAVSRTEALLLGVLGAVAAFTPMAAHNFFIGMSGVAWLGANVLAVLAIAAFLRGHSRGSFGWIALSFVVALLAGQFYSTGVVAMLAVGVQGLMLPRTRRLGVVFLAVGLAYLAVIYLIQRVPEGHGERTFDVGAIWAFATAFIGAGLTRSIPLAQLWGTLGIAVFAWLSFRFAAGGDKHRPAGAFWIALACFALMNGGIAAIGRSGLGGEAGAAASRYASLPSLFWISLLGLALSFRRSDDGTITTHPLARHFVVRGVVLLGGAAALTLVLGAEGRVEGLLKRSTGKPAAGLALALGVRDDALLKAHVTSAPSQVWAKEAGMRKVGQVPFNRVPDCPAPGTRLDIREDAPPRQAMLGHLDYAKAANDGWFRIHGWALAPAMDRPPLIVPAWPLDRRGCMVIVDAAGTVLGVGIGGEERPDVGAHFDRGDSAYGWVAYARRPDADGPARVYAAVREERTGAWVRVPHHLDLPQRH